MSDKLPLLPTTVIGSHATPSWLWTAISEIENGNYGPTDIKETYDVGALFSTRMPNYRRLASIYKLFLYEQGRFAC